MERVNPVRTCIGCGAKEAQGSLVRLRVVAGRVELDREGAGGRGAWLHASGACLERAAKRQVFARAFRDASVRADVPTLRELLTGSPRKD